MSNEEFKKRIKECYECLDNIDNHLDEIDEFFGLAFCDIDYQTALLQLRDTLFYITDRFGI